MASSSRLPKSTEIRHPALTDRPFPLALCYPKTADSEPRPLAAPYHTPAYNYFQNSFMVG
jgi:hypothetical protein